MLKGWLFVLIYGFKLAKNPSFCFDESNNVLFAGSHGSLGKQKGAFMAGAGTQIMHAHAASASQMPILSEVIKKTLNEDEAAAVHRHIKRVRDNLGWSLCEIHVVSKPCQVG